MKTTRKTAVDMFRTLGVMALGYLDDETLTAVMDNFNAFRRIAEDFEALKVELAKRIYGDMEQKEESERKRFVDFMAIVEKIGNAKTAEKRDELETLAKETYADLYELRVKEVKVITSLLNKEVEVDITPVDADRFCKGVIKGRKDIPIHEVRTAFSFMFTQEQKEDDFSELDELMID